MSQDVSISTHDPNTWITVERCLFAVSGQELHVRTIFCQTWTKPVSVSSTWRTDIQTYWERVWQIRKQMDREMIVSYSVSMSWCSPSCPVMKDRLAAHKSPERQGSLGSHYWGKSCVCTIPSLTTTATLHPFQHLHQQHPTRTVCTCERTDYTRNNKHERAHECVSGGVELCSDRKQHWKERKYIILQLCMLCFFFFCCHISVKTA